MRVGWRAANRLARIPASSVHSTLISGDFHRLAHAEPGARVAVGSGDRDARLATGANDTIAVTKEKQTWLN
jgi:hypothetical protein